MQAFLRQHPDEFFLSGIEYSRSPSVAVVFLLLMGPYQFVRPDSVLDVVVVVA